VIDGVDEVIDDLGAGLGVHGPRFSGKMPLLKILMFRTEAGLEESETLLGR